MLRRPDPERKMTLKQVTNGNDYRHSDHLGKNGIDVYIFNQHFQQNVVQKEIGHKNKEIAEQLYPAPDIGIHKNQVFHEHKTQGEIDQECSDQGGDMGLESIEAQVEHTLLENEFIADGIDQEAQHRIGPATGGIAKGLQGHDPAEWRMEKINKRK